MTKNIDGTKRARKYPCPFCLSEHNSSMSIAHCIKNPDREANKKKRSELNRQSYEKSGAREKLAAANRSEVVYLKRSLTAKKTWEKGLFRDNKGPNNGMYGKKHSLETRLKLSKNISAAHKQTQQQRVIKQLDKDLEKENIAIPMFNDASSFFNQKMDKDGWIEVDSSFGNNFDDEFDPFH